MGPSKQLRSLLAPFPDLAVRGSRAVKITGICSHSKQVAPGHLFIARRGSKFDGARYIPDALKAGAVAIASDLYDPSLSVPQIIAPNLKEVEGRLADAFYGHPSRKLTTIGVTGTSGKTSTTYLIHHLLEGMGVRSGLIGSVDVITGNRRSSTGYTTPDAASVHRLLYEMYEHKCKVAILEATSHGLDQGRLEGVHFDLALFTNLSHEHLDYHGTIDAYAKAKSTLFCGVAKSALNGDDPWHKEMKGAREVFLYGLCEAYDLYATAIKETPKETLFTAHYKGEQADITLPLIGRFNVYNALLALLACLTQGYPLRLLAPHFSSFQGVPGRLERISNAKGLAIYVDFAHKPDALKEVLQTLRSLKPKRLITVVGCGGDRDRDKRPIMGKVASELSDVALFTSDNPRSEDPLTICQEMDRNFANAKIIVDRRCAINHAISMATCDDLILIAGRGCEEVQVFANQVIPFDDRKVAKEICE